MSKYYVPDLEEFCVGFRYGYIEKAELNGHNGWMTLQGDLEEDCFCKVTYPDPYYGYNPSDILKHSPLVKFLDKQDIEELGWKSDPRNSYYDLEEFQLHLDIHPKHNVTIFNDDSEVIFQGTIKNYNELQTLMFQLSTI